MCVKSVCRAPIARRGVDGFGDGEMRRMRPIAQRADHEQVDALEQRPRGVGNAAAIGQIREAADAIAEDLAAAHARPAPARSPCVRPRQNGPRTDERAQPRHVLVAVLGALERVVEDAPQVGAACARRRRAESPSRWSVLKRRSLVEAEDVIGVAVREQHRVDARDVERQRLRAEVGRRVDEDRRARVERGRRRTAASACRADRSTGRRRSGSQSSARPATCRCRGT